VTGRPWTNRATVLLSLGALFASVAASPLPDLAASPTPSAAPSLTPRPTASLQPLPSLQPVLPLDPAGARPRLSKEVVAYLPYWVATSADVPYDPQVDPYIVDGRLTDIVLFSVGIRRNGSLKLDTPGAEFVLSPRAASIIDAAHARGIRVLVSFTSGGYENNARLFGDERAMARFVAEATALVHARGLDGADMDIELIEGDWFDAFAATAGALKDSLTALDPSARVMVATNGNRSGARMARRAIAAGADRAFLMGYAYRGPTTSPVGSISPLDRADDGLDLRDSLQLYRDRNVPLDQVIVGLPAYGLTYATVGPGRLAERAPARVSERGRVTLFRNVGAGVPVEGRVMDEDLVEGSARVVWYDVDRNAWFQTYYDTPATLRAKYVLAHEAGTAGVGMWTLGYDAGLAGYPELVGQIFSRPVVGSVVIEPRVGAAQAVEVASTTYDGLAATADIRLSNDGIHWSPWMDPALMDPARDGPLKWDLAAGSDGPRAVHVQSRDVEGDLSAPVIAAAYVDRAPPLIDGFSLRPAPIPGWIAQFVAADAGGVATTEIRWQVDDRRWTDWRLLDSLAAGSIIAPANAPVRAELRVTDRAGRTTTAATQASGWQQP
jgi:spore germination protein YaaH